VIRLKYPEVNFLTPLIVLDISMSDSTIVTFGDTLAGCSNKSVYYTNNMQYPAHSQIFADYSSECIVSTLDNTNMSLSSTSLPPHYAEGMMFSLS
jgi:hypothetical protein